MIDLLNKQNINKIKEVQSLKTLDKINQTTHQGEPHDSYLGALRNHYEKQSAQHKNDIKSKQTRSILTILTIS